MLLYSYIQFPLFLYSHLASVGAGSMTSVSWSYLVLAGVELPARQFEESGTQLEQENVGQPVLVHQQHAVN